MGVNGTVPLVDDQGVIYDVPADEVNGAKLQGLKPVEADPAPNGMGDVKAYERKTRVPNGWATNAINAFGAGIAKSRFAPLLIPQDELGEMKEYGREAAQENPKTAKVANFLGELQTPESQWAGKGIGGALKLGLQANAVKRAADALGLTPWAAKNAGAARMKWNSGQIQNAVSAGQVAKDTLPGIGAAAGGAIGHGMAPFGIGAEFGAVAGDSLGRFATGLPPISRGGFWHSAMAPAVDIGKTLASPVTSPALEFQTAKALPWLGRVFGRPTGDEPPKPPLNQQQYQGILDEMARRQATGEK